jgi:hypothetical protein
LPGISTLFHIIFIPNFHHTAIHIDIWHDSPEMPGIGGWSKGLPLKTNCCRTFDRTSFYCELGFAWLYVLQGFLRKQHFHVELS